MKQIKTRLFIAYFAGMLVLALANSPAASGQESAEDSSVSPADESIEEITVYGERNINILRRQFNLAQERTFDVFNTLNSTDEFDIKCDYEQHLGSRRWVHVCTPKFNTRPQAHLGGTYFVTYDGEDKPSTQSPRIRRLNKELWEEMARLVNEDTKLRASIMELAAKKNALDAELERRRKD